MQGLEKGVYTSQRTSVEEKRTTVSVKLYI